MKLLSIFTKICVILLISTTIYASNWIENDPNSKEPIELLVGNNSVIMIDCVQWIDRWEVGYVRYLNGDFNYKLAKDSVSMSLLINKDGMASINCETPKGDSINVVTLKVSIDKLSKAPSTYFLYLDYHNLRYKIYN